MSHLDNMTGFRVEIKLGSAMVESSNSLHLDALLQAENAGIHGLKMINGVPMASKVFFHNKLGVSADTRRGWIRRLDHIAVSRELGNKDGLLSEEKITKLKHKEPITNSGKLKNYGNDRSCLDLTVFTHAVAWGVGDIELVKVILSRVTNIGPKRSNGHGHVVSIDVIEDPAALKHWKCRVLRTEEEVDNPDLYAPVVSCLKGPYWMTENSEVAKIYIGDCPSNSFTDNTL